MIISLPHSVVNETVPDADEVMENDQKLLGAVNGVQAVGGVSSQTVVRKTEGSTSTVLSAASQSVTVADDSLMVVSFEGHVSYANMAPGSWSAILALLVGGVSQRLAVHSQTLTFDPFDAQEETHSLGGTKLVSLSAGTHTVALQWTVAITTSSGALEQIGVTGNGGSWTGLVVPAWE